MGFSLWNLGTLIGALAGSGLGDPRTYGLDAAAPAAFVALLWPRLTDPRLWSGRWVGRVLAAGSALLAVALVPLVPAGIPVLIVGAAAIAVGVGRIGERAGKEGENA